MREIILILFFVFLSILSFSIAKEVYECDEVERKIVTFEREICSEQQLINAEIKEIRDEEIPNINDSIGKHSIVL